MVAAAMELKRLGLARKPMFAVPNHMLGQFSTELLTLYPGANILVAARRISSRRTARSCSAASPPAIGMPSSSRTPAFERIPLSRETQERFFEEQLHELEMIGGNTRQFQSPLGEGTGKAKKRLEAKLKALAAEHKKDNTLTFEELGVDRLFVDEAHYFKNLFYVSKMTRIAGLPQTASANGRSICSQGAPRPVA
jgi:N12 class adenine-specific DNA methylase